MQTHPDMDREESIMSKIVNLIVGGYTAGGNQVRPARYMPLDYLSSDDQLQLNPYNFRKCKLNPYKFLKFKL